MLMPDLLRTCRRTAVASVLSFAVLLVAVPAAMAALQPFYSTSGSVDMSQNGYASNTGAVTKPIVKPSATATVQKAYLFAAGIPGYTPQNGDITLDGSPVVFTDTPVTASFGAITRESDVTSIVKPIVDAAPAGNVNQTVDEVNNTFVLDGEALVVIFNDPAVSNNSIALMYGTEDTTGDTFHVGFAQPINLSTESIQFAIGDSYSYQGVSGSPVDQYSLIDVNGTPPDPSDPTAGPDPARLTTSAGGQDDEVPGCDNNGCLLTIGGVGDSPSNPANPFAIPSTCGATPPYRCDDELYTLGSPYVHNGDTSMSVYTLNPSNDDDIFYSSFFFQGLAAVVGEGITLAPPSQSDTVGTNATVTAHVQDTSGNPVSGKTVTFTVTSGPNAGKTGTGVTDASGNASFTYTSSTTGTDNVDASFVDNSGNTKTSNSVTVTWTSQADTTPPTCKVTSITYTPPPAQEKVTVQDTGSGLASIYNIAVTNGTVSVAPFTVGTTSPVVVTATKTNQSQTTKWSFYAKDVAGNVMYCN
jgi:Bacterial Ig-like domain (group 1)